ncbi:hypothetical protein O5629_27945, partial [Escherichia coli]|nr:hypothetical protein [Escherichia coli]
MGRPHTTIGATAFHFCFLKDDANIHAIQRAAVLGADSFKAGGKV